MREKRQTFDPDALLLLEIRTDDAQLIIIIAIGAWARTLPTFVPRFHSYSMRTSAVRQGGGSRPRSRSAPSMRGGAVPQTSPRTHAPMHLRRIHPSTLLPHLHPNDRSRRAATSLSISLSLYLSISLSISLLTDDGRPPVDGPWRFLIYERLTACGRLGKGARNSRLSASHPAGHPEGSRTGAGRRKALVPNFRNWFCMRAVFSSPGLFPVTCGVIRNSTIVCVC